MNRSLLIFLSSFWLLACSSLQAQELLAGVAKIEITDRDAGAVSDPLFAKALVLKRDKTLAVLITLDAVAIGEIGSIKDEALKDIRKQLHKDLQVPAESVIVNASHCHGRVRADTGLLVVQAVKQAFAALEPVVVGVGVGSEEGISENRRLIMKDGRQIDMRRAYSLPPDEEVASVGPIDPEVGVLRLDRLDGRPKAVLYNFACHPIMGAPGGANTAGFSGFASRLLEDALGEGSIALFVQGCGGDINPVRYKTVGVADGEPLGNRLGGKVLQTWRGIKTQPNAELKLHHEVLKLPRGKDFQQRIKAIDAERDRIVRSLRSTDINFKTFLPLLLQHRLSPEAPSYHVQGYLHDEKRNREDLKHADAVNLRNVEAYLKNIHAMEELTRLNVNQALLRKNLIKNEDAEHAAIEAELIGLRVGDFRMVTFPGELTVGVGLQLKKAAPHPFSFVAGYTNGYIYYLPTAAQRKNSGYAQEDCDCLVAPEWHEIFQAKALQALTDL